MRVIEEHVVLVLPYLQELEILPVFDQDGGEPLHELVALYSAPPASEGTPLPDLRRALARSRHREPTGKQAAAAAAAAAAEDEEAVHRTKRRRR